MIEQPAIVQDERQAEQAIVEDITAAVSASDWVVGEKASEWVQGYARGRTDEDLAEMVGQSRKFISNRRRVFERFGEMWQTFATLRWSFFLVAIGWTDAVECLIWADETGATIKEMTAYHNVKNGINPKPPAKKQPEPADEPRTITTVSPEPTARIVMPSKPVEQATAKPQAPPDLKSAASQAIKALRVLAEGADSKATKATARALRKLANELDPPKAKFVPPTLEEVKEYFAEKGTHIRPDLFYAFYNGNGWKQANGNRLTEWHGCLVTWEARDWPTHEKQDGGTAQSSIDRETEAIVSGSRR